MLANYQCINLNIKYLIVFIVITNVTINWSNARLPWQNYLGKNNKRPQNQLQIFENRIKVWDERVKNYLDSKQPDKALSFLKETLRLDSSNHYSLGMTAYLLLIYKQDYQSAKEMAQRGLNKSPRSIYCLHTLAWLHYLEKEFGLAYRVIQEISETEFPWFDLQFHWAMISWKAHQRKVAMEHFSTARKLKPKHAPLWISLGMFLEEEKKIESAIKAYQSALKLVSENSPVKTYLLSKLDELLPIYESREQMPSEFIGIESKSLKSSKLFKSKNTHPNEKQSENLQADNNLGPNRSPSKMQDNRNSTTSIENISMGINKDSLDQSRNPFLKPIELNMDQFQEDNQSLEQLSIAQHFQIGQDLLKAEIREEAVAQFQTVINLWGTNDYTVPAKTSLDKAKSLGFQTFDKRIEKLFDYGNLLFQQGRLKECLYIQRKVLIISSENIKALKNAAFLYLKFKRPITALTLLDQSLKAKPDYLEAQVLKAYSLAMLRRFSSAAEILSNIVIQKNNEFTQDYANQLKTTIDQYHKPLNR